MFQGGRPGVGLLVLRGLVGLTWLAQGGVYLADRAQPTPALWVAGLLAVAVGAALLAGLLTPFAALLSGLGCVIAALSWIPAALAPALFHSKLTLVFVSVTSATVVLLGPGAYSLDARLFGRREIIIPHAARAPRP